MKKLNNYLLFWFGQAVSQLGSFTTSFALTIWVFKQTGSAMSVSLLSFCSYLPYVLVSILAGGFVDKHSKKSILIISDTIAAICTISIFFCLQMNMLSIWQICFVNLIVGFMNAFQSPSASIVTGLLVPNEQYDKASGLNSFTSNLVTVVSPVLAGMFMAFAGLKMVLFNRLSNIPFCCGNCTTRGNQRTCQSRKKRDR